MANTIMTAKNSFQEGLIMDFSPDNTQATCMTSALNATLITSNGNEMLLLNDMGNAIVETAFLPEGYIPVGTCEFGDIIYIVSYNPITNKSLIGCFPSPERNISSEELYDKGENGYTNISAKDFLEIKEEIKDGIKKEVPTGKIISNSVKKVLINTKKLNPGDKYIIYSNSGALSTNKECLSDYGTEIGHNILPKYLKLHVVSIEDSGKITYLDTTTNWYDINNEEGDKYYISPKKIGTNKETDINEYRNLVQSNWSIFNSKVSGKLAILAELETIDTFSCSYNLVDEISKDGYKKYKIIINPESTALNKLIPSHICIDDFSATTNDDKILIDGLELYNDVDKSRLKYKKSITIGTIELPEKADNPDSLIFTLKITPAMPYGRLEHLSTTLTIDFNKVGKGDVELTTWKYYNTDTTSILTFGIDAYPKPNLKVEKVVIQIRDNLANPVGEYLLSGKNSYSGKFTEYLGLNKGHINPRFTLHDSVKNILIKHKGEELTNIENISIYEDNPNYIVEEGKVYINDAGTLYPGIAYLAVIYVYLTENITQENNLPTPIYRWFWTNTMYNEYYYSVNDFKELKFELILNGEAIFETNSYYTWRQKEINNLNVEYINEDYWKTYSANVLYIGYGGENNINMYIRPGLQNDYGCFNLYGRNKDGLIGDILNINVDIYLGKSEIRYSDTDYEFSVKETNVSEANYLALNNKIKYNANISNDKIELDYPKFDNILENLNSAAITEDNIKNVLDIFDIYINSSLVEYDDLSKEGGYIYAKYSTSLDNCYYASEVDKKHIPLSMLALLLNKAYTLGETGGTVSVPVYTPIIDTADDLSALGIGQSISGSNITLFFNEAVALNHRGNDFSAAKLTANSGIFNLAETDDNLYKFTVSDKLVDPSKDSDFLNKTWGKIGTNISTFFPVYIGGWNDVEHFDTIIGSSAKGLANNTNWKDFILWGKETSRITTGTFDIHGSSIQNANTNNSVSFLGVKYRDGMTVLNTAFRDGVNNGNTFLLNAANMSFIYDNFAYLLYLLLTNTYHKNKRIKDLQINLKNYVRNGNYTVELLKDIIIKLLYVGKDTPNIIMHGLDFNSYISLVVSSAETGEEISKKLKLEKNVTLKFLDFAKNHELKIIIKSEPMEFFNTDIDAYIRRNGELLPVDNLAPDCFYVYQNEQLLQYSNGKLVFPYNSVALSLKYIFNVSNGTLLGINPPKNTVYTDLELAINAYLELFEKYIGDGPSYLVGLYESEYDAKFAAELYINNMFASFPDSLHGHSKNYIRNLFTEYDLLEIGNELFSILQLSYSKWLFTILPSNVLFLLDQHKMPGKSEIKEYEFSSNNFLNLFDYLNEFITKPTYQFGNTFGIKDGGRNKNSAYAGFPRDILLDTNYKVVG